MWRYACGLPYGQIQDSSFLHPLLCVHGIFAEASNTIARQGFHKRNQVLNVSVG